MPSASITKNLMLLVLATVVSCSTATVAADTAKPTGKQAPAVRMYRYKNDKGVLVTSSRITPEYARKGYDIVNLGGTVLETIPPEPTAEERAAYEQAAQDKLSAAEQQEHDKQLLLRYSSTQELQHAKERKLKEIESKIRMLQSNLSGIKKQIEQEQQRAANLERGGREVAPATLAKIDALQKERAVSEDQLQVRQREMTEESARFDKEIERYTFLEKKRASQQ